MVTAYQEAKAHAFASFALWQEPMDTIGLVRESEFARRAGKGWKAQNSIGPFGNRGDVRGTQKSQGERKREREENGTEVFWRASPPRVYDLLPKRGHFTCPLPEQTQQRFGKQSVPNGIAKFRRLWYTDRNKARIGFPWLPDKLEFN